AAARRERDASAAAARKAAEAAQVAHLVRAAEANHAKAQALLKDGERALLSNDAQVRAHAAAGKAKALARVEEAKVQLDAAGSTAQPKLDAAARADEEANLAAAAKASAEEAAQEAARNTSPVSVFVSRKTQRYYVRKGNYPLLEGPVTIRAADK